MNGYQNMGRDWKGGRERWVIEGGMGDGAGGNRYEKISSGAI